MIISQERHSIKAEKKIIKKAAKRAALAAAEQKRLQLEEAAQAAAERKNYYVLNPELHKEENKEERKSKKKHSKVLTSNGKFKVLAMTTVSESLVQPKPKKKRLRILTSNGEFSVSPMTPPKVQFGFKEMPLTLTPHGFKVELLPKATAQSSNAANAVHTRKRRRVLDFDEPSKLLQKPKWLAEKLFGRFEQTHQEKRYRENNEAHVSNTGPTEFILRPLQTTKRPKAPSSSIIPAELMEYRKQNLYRKGVPRQVCHIDPVPNRANRRP